jgi:phosphopantetheine--protein transferase-like protein
MIYSIGIDLVETARMQPWCTFSHERLCSTFSEQELYDARDEHGVLAAEKLATRFAAKEAFYKALCTLLQQQGVDKMPGLMFVCRHFAVHKKASGVPFGIFDWEAFTDQYKIKCPPVTIHLSLAHERTMAIAFVIIQGAV